ncbi:hypothetical protein [Vagococcus fessus]|uniref:Uncharacterized protein n=1 Tax=Vagococcus fessus TaxID=120370 RepID=A0A430A6B6_9ENTE|nr:hypothetical protein [Vagococcus fessus]RSU02419.1 hypothetical protein CBF31_08605 [Vagococcus fessus]
MRMKFRGEFSIKFSSVVEFCLWIVGYLPVSMIILVKYFFSDDIPSSKWNSSIAIFNINVRFQIFMFILIAISTIFIFKITLYILKIWISRKLKSPYTSKINRIIKFNKLTLEKYSFFILSLMLPFIFESGESVFDLLIIFTLILVLIIIMIKMEQITVNPIFLFSSLNVIEATVDEVGETKRVTIITNYSIVELENIETEAYFQYFNNVYFLIKKS